MRGVKVVVCLGISLFFSVGCGLITSKQTKERTAPPLEELTPVFTPVPTVPPQPVTPVPAAPLPTRPVGDPEAAAAAKKRGEAVGPVISHLGVARADGTKSEPLSVDKNGVPTYVTKVGSGFMIVIEGKPGISDLEVGRRVMAYDVNDVNGRPDLEIQTNRDLGNGSPAVCDRRKPNIGGIPGINPPSFDTTKKVAEVTNDLACRFEVFIDPTSACTVTKQGDFAFLNSDSKVQFCMIVARAWNFPLGDTTVSVRLRDKDGNPGQVKKMIIRRPEKSEETPRPQPTLTPTPIRRRP